MWGSHLVVVNNAEWHRNWVNRATYVHPYAIRRAVGPGPRVAERHVLEGRTDREKAAERAGGRRPVEEHGKGKEDRRDDRR